MVIRERENNGVPGLPVLVAVLAGAAFLIWQLVEAARAGSGVGIAASAIGLVLALVVAAGLFMVNPNEGQVLQLFGDYVGTARAPGLRWANPFLSKRRVSMRIRNFDSSHLKVNDNDGNPIEIGAVVVWKVVDTAEAVFEVDDYENYVQVQTEAALRNLASSYAYDAHDDTHTSLRGHTAVVADHLKREVQDRLAKAGVQVIEARISHLAYAPEIAAAMLQRQQAGAIIAARQRIVEGAVGMVEMALAQLSAKSIVVLDDERRAAMVSNLLVVLCGERGAQPIVNTGTIYQ
jgi:regulator of protease activity HflC (stomatin/prohibitin superfamily)